jgi:predicted dehydrogenase
MSSFESFVCFEKYGLSGWVTRTSRPSIENSSVASSFPTKNRLHQFRALQHAQAIVEKTGRKRPEGYASGPEDYRRLVVREDLDAVITATPWELHTPIAVAAMKAGKYAATEVPAAITSGRGY